MIVCSHGDVKNYCEDKDMIIVESYDGDIEKYDGISRVLVTGEKLSESEYYFLKGKMFAKGVELVSIYYKDNKSLSDYIVNTARNELEQRQKHTGRHKFGFRKENGEIVHHEHNFNVARTIIELRDSGCTLAKIRDDSRVRHQDGRKLSLSTINLIIKNRKDYE